MLLSINSYVISIHLHRALQLKSRLADGAPERGGAENRKLENCMKMFNINIIRKGFFQIASIIFFILFLFGGLNIYFSDRNNYCAMTYMYEYPRYVRMPMPENSIYPQYGLYVYSEGRVTEEARKMWFGGTPVLYLPGNLGSHKQVRSIASVAFRKAIESNTDFYFEFFTVDFNEELSGIYGGVLEKQTEFAAYCVKKIIKLYKYNKYLTIAPTHVIIIGHSMGGLIAKRLLTYPSTMNMTIVAISLAAPSEAPLINFDAKINEYYMEMNREWEEAGNQMDSKLLLSIGNGARDILMPSGLTSSKGSDINALTTSMPAVWVSPDHVSIVWCKQFVLALNRFLFASVDLKTNQIRPHKPFLLAQAKKQFVSHRSNILDPNIIKRNKTMLTDAFWYEDNRLSYQITRPEIKKMTYLMIRLASFPQNRFVAIESINVESDDWLFGCAANEVYGTYRYCSVATSITELSKWNGVANDFGKRKLATVHLHNLMDIYPKWTHVIVKVAPTKKHITLNVDINDHASRVITVNLPYMVMFGKTIIKEETMEDAVYYELILPELKFLYQTYYLYVEPIPSCKATKYHSTAEIHFPWAKNYDYYHYFTFLKKSPMKIRLFKNNPNLNDSDASGHAKITLLLDPRCTYTISIAPSVYHQIGHLLRHYYPLLVPFVTAILILAARANFISLKRNGSFMWIHGALMDDGLKPYYILVGARLGNMVIVSVPVLSFIFETANTRNEELQYFTRSLLTIPAYMIALGIVNVVTAVMLVIMVFSSHLTHRLLFRIIWRGGNNLTEKLAGLLQKVPTVVSAALACAVPLSCGAAALVAGAAYYSFMLSKMYEECLEDFAYRLMAKFASKFCKSNKPKETVQPKPIEKQQSSSTSTKVGVESEQALKIAPKQTTSKLEKNPQDEIDNAAEPLVPGEDGNKASNENKNNQMNGLHFHTLMFLLWLIVTLVNVPALITWARNFKYAVILNPDTSCYTGIIMSVCGGFIWQMEYPRRNLKYYEMLQQVLFLLAVLILVLVPLGLYFINHIVTTIFIIITLQQLFDHEEIINPVEEVKGPDEEASRNDDKEKKSTEEPENEQTETQAKTGCETDENKIYDEIKDIREKIALVDDL